MALYTNRFGDCATCEDVFPGPPAPPPPPAGTTIYVDQTSGSSVVCPAPPPSRWWVWLLIGLGLGYLVNE